MRAIAVLLVVVVTGGMLVDASAAPHSRKKGKSKRATMRLERAQEGRRQALNLLKNEGSPLLQSLAGLQPLSQPVILDGEDPEEVAREDDVTVDIASIRTLWMAYVDGEPPGNSGLSPREVMDFIVEWLGRPYRFGGTSAEGIDCSAFMQQLFRSCVSVSLPRTAQEQFAYGMPIEKPENLQFGDLVFFHTRSHAYVSHVGIYIGDNLFAHASSRYGVTISSLESTYYRTRFLGGRRLTLSDFEQLALRSELR